MSTVEVVTEDEMALVTLADTVHREYRRSRDALADSIEAYFAAGHALLEARLLLPSDPAFGAWMRAQDFGFNRQWAYVLRLAAEHESDVRALLTTQVVSSGSTNIKKAVQQVTAALGDGRDDRPELVPALGTFSTVVIDPPWRYENVATRGAAEDHYPTMTLDELAELEIPAAPDAHLYLWVTNGFIREGFDLLDAWGFTYKTCLTWTKPSIGMGNWFRNSTEHVLFGVRGRLPTRRNDVPTHFEAPRTRHSAKPERFYDLVESCSPGPWFEMFARRRRLGDWSYWGNEA